MLFAGNGVVLMNRETGAFISFNAADAIRACDPPGATSHVTVATAGEWRRSACVLSLWLLIFDPSLTQLKSSRCRLDVETVTGARDWTFTTQYSGTVGKLAAGAGGEAAASSVRIEAATERIDFEVLKRQDPILWNAAITLFEDELEDNGSSQFVVKAVRAFVVMLAAFA